MDLVAYLGNGQHHQRASKGHEGCSKVEEDEPSSSIQQEDVNEEQEEEELIWLQKSHFLNSSTQLAEVFHQHFLWEAPVLHVLCF